jgi:hypothetical protein
MSAEVNPGGVPGAAAPVPKSPKEKPAWVEKLGLVGFEELIAQTDLPKKLVRPLHRPDHRTPALPAARLPQRRPAGFAKVSLPKCLGLSSAWPGRS